MFVVRIDLHTNRVVREEVEDVLSAGRHFIARMLSDECDPGTDPLGPENPLIFTNGPFAGWPISSAGRLSVGGKSPLTGGIKESNAGGELANALAGLDCRAVILYGALAEPGIVVMDGADAVRILPADAYWGLDTEECVRRLNAEYGDGYAMAVIGPAGEMQLPASAICVTDARGQPFRFAARGGLAAVMGSKRLKALLVRRQKRPLPADPAFLPAVRALHKAIGQNPRVETLRKYGTASTVMLTQSWGGLPTRNFRQGTFERAEAISGEAVYRLITTRGGEGTPTEACMGVCMIQCSNIYPDAEGRRLVGKIEYETLAMCGSNLGIGDPDTIARINQRCNALGLDTIEMGTALGVAAEAGLMEFGDGERALELLEEVARGTPLGRLLGQGCAVLGRVLGVERVPAVKGQGMPAYDPRAIKGTGVTFATSPMGADHTAGLTVFARVDHHAAEGQVELSRQAQIDRAAFDALGLCAFLMGSTAGRPELLLDILRAGYGVEWGPEWLNELGRQVIEMERAFNLRAGITPAVDRLPAFFEREPLPPHGETFDIPPDALRNIWST
ncbi:MAG: aldehyde ferredoxin oxidoreductase [Anaerolineae bacterium]|nr:aldehyde ferredoxin oxidoreductase [Anaerolineae bacterium]